MPDQFERHGRSAEREWGGGQSSRSQQRAAAASDDPLKNSTPSKKKKGACKGPDGWHDKHDLVFVIQLERIAAGMAWRQSDRRECGWTAAWSIKQQKYTAQWGCLHSQVCSRCDHREREHWSMTRVLCPSYTGQQPVPEEVLASVRQRQAEYELRMARTRTRYKEKTVITGPQGYRKRKEGNE